MAKKGARGKASQRNGVSLRCLMLVMVLVLFGFWACILIVMRPTTPLGGQEPGVMPDLAQSALSDSSLNELSSQEEELRKRVYALNRHMELSDKSGAALGASGAASAAALSPSLVAAAAARGVPAASIVAPPSVASNVVAATAPAAKPGAAYALRGAAQGAGQIGTGAKITEADLRRFAGQGATAVVVISCKRPKYLKRAMDSFLRPQRDPQMFPFLISQDGNDAAMTEHIESSYVAKGLAYHMYHQHESNAESVARRFGGTPMARGYVYIAQHYGFALRKVFDEFGFEQLIFLEEDMEIAPDFFSYFGSMLPLLKRDPELYCVSAWNDNGYSTLVQDPKAVYRTDFFPGLGWMLDRSMWQEVSHRWPDAYWDEFMRRPDVRKGRHCIRPEISRTFTFGEQGTSEGQFFNQHLSRIKLNDVFVDWSKEDLSFLSPSSAFDDYLSSRLREAHEVGFRETSSYTQGNAVLRVMYDDKRDYARIAGFFHLMKDEKEGIRRMSYKGVIPFASSGNRVYLYTATWPADRI